MQVLHVSSEHHHRSEMAFCSHLNHMIKHLLSILQASKSHKKILTFPAHIGVACVNVLMPVHGILAILTYIQAHAYIILTYIHVHAYIPNIMQYHSTSIDMYIHFGVKQNQMHEIFVMGVLKPHPPNNSPDRQDLLSYSCTVDVSSAYNPKIP
jgi:hypothetical protein